MRIVCMTHNLFFLNVIIILRNSSAAVVGKDGTYAVLRGSVLTLNCIPKNLLNGLNDIGTSYTWTDEEGREIIGARFTIRRNGDMDIVNAHVGDSGIYKCKFYPSTTSADSKTLSKVYEHKLIVYELSGHKFVSSVSIDMSSYSQEVIQTLLQDLLRIKVCHQELCTTDTVKSLTCSETKETFCVFSMPYEAYNQIADEKCDEDCVRQNMFDALKQAEKILERQLLEISEDPRGRIKADMRTFDTKHLIMCRAGFHLVKGHYKRCFPCVPGYYSEPNSVTCTLCKIGYYQEHYGKEECDKCKEGQTTDIMGAKSRDDCVAQESGGVINNIKQRFVSFFTG